MSAIKTRIGNMLEHLEEIKLFQIYNYVKFISDQPPQELLFEEDDESRIIKILQTEESTSIDDVKKHLGI